LTGVNSRVAARFRNSSKSCPASFIVALLPRDVEPPRAVRGANDLPAVAGRLVRVQQDRARRAAPRGLLVLVRPASVVSERLAAKEVRLGRGRGRIVDEHHENLTLVVFRAALPVVPLLLRRVDAVADEDEVFRERHALRLRAREADEVVAELERLFAARAGDVQQRVWISLHADERHGLEETPIRTRAAQTKRLQLRGQILGRQFPAPRTRRAPFHRVVRQKLDVRPQRTLADPARSVTARLRHDRDAQRNNRDARDDGLRRQTF
jgi:hypothetical protein